MNPKNLTYKAWSKAAGLAGNMMEALGISERDARAHIAYSKKRKGYRVTVVRMSDGMTRTGFIPDGGK